MKNIFKYSLLTILSVNTFVIAYSQVDDNASLEEYIKSNLALSKFKLLGVNDKQYAKCLETVNYMESNKKLKFVVIEKTDFADDGMNYDLVANDGILTSSTAFAYSPGADIIQRGAYQNTPSHDSFIFDEAFTHQAQINSTGKSASGCRLKWVRCSQMTNPAQQFLCNWAGWPYGSLVITGCQTGHEF